MVIRHIYIFDISQELKLSLELCPTLITLNLFHIFPTRLPQKPTPTLNKLFPHPNSPLKDPNYLNIPPPIYRCIPRLLTSSKAHLTSLLSTYNSRTLQNFSPASRTDHQNLRAIWKLFITSKLTLVINLRDYNYKNPN